MRILENKSGELTLFEEVDTRMNFENTFRDIAKAANTTAHNAKLTIELHGKVLTKELRANLKIYEINIKFK